MRLRQQKLVHGLTPSRAGSEPSRQPSPTHLPLPSQPAAAAGPSASATRSRSRYHLISSHYRPSSLHSYLITLLLAFITLFSTPTQAAGSGVFGPDQLYTSSVAYCSPPEVILVSAFGLRFFRENRTLEFDIAAASVNNNVSAIANVSVNAYGLGIFNVNLDLCTIANGILCPLPTYNFNGGGLFPVPEQFASKIPKIAFKIPDLEAVATVQLVDQTGRIVACLQATLSNGHTTYQVGAIWGTIGLAILAAASSLLHSVIPASIGAAQWRIVDVMAAIQHVAVVSLLSLTYPVAFSSYASNFAWSIGMINIPSLQNSITATRSATGDKQTGLFGNALEADGGRKYDPFLKRSSAPSIASFEDAASSLIRYRPKNVISRLSRDDPAALLKDISFNEQSSLTRFNSTAFNSSRLLALEHIYAPNTGPDGQLLTASSGGPLPIIYPNTTQEQGIDLFAERLDIAPPNVFLTVLVNFVILLGLMLAVIALIYVFARFLGKMFYRSEPNFWSEFTKASHFGGSFTTAFVGRYLLVTFPVLLIFAFYQWRFGSSWVPHLVAGLVIAIWLVGLAAFFVPMFVHATRSGKESLYYPEDLPPAQAGRVPKVWGSFAHPWKPKFYWAYLIFILWSFIRAAWIAFGQHHGFRQAVGLLVFELVLFVALCVIRPGRDKSSNAVIIVLCLSRVISWAICVAFTRQAHVTTIPRVVVGFVLLVATGIPIIFLFFLTVIDLFEPLRSGRLRTIKRMAKLRLARNGEAEKNGSDGSSST